MADPFSKVIDPAGIAVPDCAITFAVKVTFCPVLIAVAEAVNEVEVATIAGVTVIATGAVTELELLVLPPYDAVIDCTPAGREVVLKEAVPLALSVAVPRVVAPFRKVTVPVGAMAPDCGATTAVKVTLCPVVT